MKNSMRESIIDRLIYLENWMSKLLDDIENENITDQQLFKSVEHLEFKTKTLFNILKEK